MDTRRGAIGLFLVAASQAAYLIGGLGFRLSIGIFVDAASVVLALWAAYSLTQDDGRRAAWALAAIAGVQTLDLVTSLTSGIDPFGIAFVVVVVGLVLVAVASLRGGTQPDAPTPAALRWGAALAGAGSASYLVIALSMGASLGLFSLGAVLAATGWALVAAS